MWIQREESEAADTKQEQAAARIDRQIGKTDVPIPKEEITAVAKPKAFQPTPPRHRKPGTGGTYQRNENLWEGRYSPRNAYGKRITANVYAKTREECEKKLAEMIEEMNEDIAEEKGRLKEMTEK